MFAVRWFDTRLADNIPAVAALQKSPEIAVFAFPLVAYVACTGIHALLDTELEVTSGNAWAPDEQPATATSTVGDVGFIAPINLYQNI